MIITISKGTIISDNKSANIVSLPLNLNLEKPKAASIVVNVQIVTPANATTTEFIKYLPNGAVSNANLKLSKFKKLLGNNCGGKVDISVEVLKAPNHPKNGNIIMIAPTINTKCTKKLLIFPSLYTLPFF